MKNYYVYIITNFTNSTLYIGVTNNLERRLYEHKNKLVDGFSKRYNLNKLVYFEETTSIENAIEREKQRKSWKRYKKETLIKNINPTGKICLKNGINRSLDCHTLLARLRMTPLNLSFRDATTENGILGIQSRRQPTSG